MVKACPPIVRCLLDLMITCVWKDLFGIKAQKADWTKVSQLKDNHSFRSYFMVVDLKEVDWANQTAPETHFELVDDATLYV